MNKPTPVAWIPHWALMRLTGKLGAVADPVDWGVDAPLYVSQAMDSHPVYDAAALRAVERETIEQCAALCDKMVRETEWHDDPDTQQASEVTAQELADQIRALAGERDGN